MDACQECGSDHDTVWLDVGNERTVLCASCRFNYLGASRNAVNHLPAKHSPDELSWSNDAAKGYVILAARSLGYDIHDLSRLLMALNREFDTHSVDGARRTFEESPF